MTTSVTLALDTTVVQGFLIFRYWRLLVKFDHHVQPWYLIRKLIFRSHNKIVTTILSLLILTFVSKLNSLNSDAIMYFSQIPFAIKTIYTIATFSAFTDRKKLLLFLV
jgi:hypothetical protein